MTLGEALVSLSPAEGGSLAGCDLLRKTTAGAEANAAATLARLGRRVAYLGLVGTDPFGDQVRAELAGEGVDVSGLRQVPGRTGLIVKELPHPHEAVSRYYRDLTPAALMQPADLDLDPVEDAAYLHVTGITAALGHGPRDVVRAAIEKARQHGVQVSLDVNHRPALWSDDECRRTIRSLLTSVDELSCNLDEAEILVDSREPTEALRRLIELGPRTVIVKDGRRGAVASVEGEQARTSAWPAPAPVDPVGAGDAFDAGWLHSRLGGASPRRCLATAAWVAAHVVQSARDADGPSLADLEEAQDQLDHWIEAQTV